jgi:hypothetical protein
MVEVLRTALVCGALAVVMAAPRAASGQEGEPEVAPAGSSEAAGAGGGPRSLRRLAADDLKRWSLEYLRRVDC